MWRSPQSGHVILVCMDLKLPGRGQACVRDILDAVTELLDTVSQNSLAAGAPQLREQEIRDIVDRLKSRFQELKETCKPLADADKTRREKPAKGPDCNLVAKRDALRKELEVKNSQLKELVDSSRKLLVLINVTTPKET